MNTRTKKLPNPFGFGSFLLSVSRQTRTEGESLAASLSAASGGRSEGAACAAVYIFKTVSSVAENIVHRKRTPALFKAKSIKNRHICPLLFAIVNLVTDNSL
jgi:hypothetical protein